MGSLLDRVNRKVERLCVPFAVHFDLTYRCSLNCIHCYLPERDRRHPTGYREELATGEISGILDQLAACGTLFLTFSGGEIFVREDVLNIVEYARKKRFSVSLMTTGSFRFDESVADRLADTGIQAVDISVYSDRSEVHDLVTGTPGSFVKTIRAIELFRERDINVKLKCPLMKVNVKDFRGVIELAESCGAEWMFDPNLTLGWDGDERPKYLRISDEEMEEFCTFVLGMNGGGKGKSAEEMFPPVCRDFLEESPCSASHSSCYISPYGDVQPCIEIGMLCGSLREKPFEEIWKNAEGMLTVRTIRRGDLRKCPDCPEPDYCHRCMGHAYVEHGDLLAAPEAFCGYTKIRLSVLKEVYKNGQKEEALHKTSL